MLGTRVVRRGDIQPAVEQRSHSLGGKVKPEGIAFPDGASPDPLQKFAGCELVFIEGIAGVCVILFNFWVDKPV